MLSVVTPWPPQRNGIADYAWEIARATVEDVTIVAETLTQARPREGVFVADALPAQARLVYHIGNNPDHAFLVPMFLRRPGLAIVHDLSLHYLAGLVDQFIPGFFAAQIRAEHPALADLALRVGRAGLARDIDHRDMRLLSWLRTAPGLVVHSHAARRILAGLLPRSAIHVLPHFCYLPGPSFRVLQEWRDGVRDRVRARFYADVSFADSPFVLVSLGAPSADKQLAFVLRAIARLDPALRAQTILLIAGEIRPDDPDPLAEARRVGVADRVRALGWLPENDTADLILVADLVLALRFPTRGESSGAVARAMGLGSAAMVSDHGSYAELPDESVVKIPARAEPTNVLRATLAALIADRSRIVRARRAAYEYAHGPADPARIAARLAELAVPG